MTRRANSTASRGSWRLVALGAALAVLAAVTYLALTGSRGTPKLAVDRTVIDFGDVSHGRFVVAEFTLTNAGDGTLTITEAPVVRVLKGC